MTGWQHMLPNGMVEEIMERNTMVNAITAQLGSLGIPCQVGAGSDISVRTTFLDAAWGTGKKQIDYQGSALLNEQERTLYFWELTKETGSGLSFTGNSESSFQSGTTLFRKVKSVGYGPDGKAYEYSLDLGAITKTFKETAKQYGWKFKVVLKKEKAMYPPGYGAQPPPQPGYVAQPPPQQGYGAQASPQPGYGAQASPQPGYGVQPPLQPGYGAQASPQKPYGNPQGAFYANGTPAQNPQGYPAPGRSSMKKDSGNPLFFFLPFGLLLAVTLVFFGFGGVSPVGWILGLALLAAPLLLRKKLAGAGFFGMAAIWVIIAVLLFILFGVFSAGS
jgi:hypothetical protein